MAVKIITKRLNAGAVMQMIPASGARVSLHSTPSSFDFSKNPEFGTVERDGKEPLVRMISPGNGALSFSHVVSNLDYRQSIEASIVAIQKCHQRGVRVRFTGGSPFFQQSRWFYIHDLKIDVKQLSGTNRVSRATLSWTLREAGGYVAPKSTAKSVTKGTAKKSTKPTKKPATARTYKVKRGDTLGKIAQKQLGRATRWREIYSLNKSKIKNPNRISVGMTLKLPKK